MVSGVYVYRDELDHLWKIEVQGELIYTSPRSSDIVDKLAELGVVVVDFTIDSTSKPATTVSTRKPAK